LRVMVDLAQRNTGEYTALREIAKRQEISVKYLEIILPPLAKAGFLDGLRGKGGGYKLAADPRTCTVASILKLLEGNLAPVACLERLPNKCKRAKKCKTLPMWKQYQKMTEDFFENITIADLCADSKKI